jgi:uncharacterized protein YndB with AHSA1/START domain
MHDPEIGRMMLALRSPRKEGRGMRVVEASAIVPLSPEEVWDLLIGDKMHQLVEKPDVSVVAVKDFQIRPDGTARYVVANKAGPSKTWHTADFTVYERPHRSVNRILDSPFGGMFYGTYQPVGEGTRVHWRWEVEAQNKLARLLLPVMHPLLARSMQQDLDALAKSFYPPEDRQRPSAARLAGPGVIVLVAASVLLVYLFRLRSKASRR